MIEYHNLSDFLSNFGTPALWECPIQQGIPILVNLAFLALIWIAVQAFLAGIRGTIFNLTLSLGDEEKIKKGREALRNVFVGAIIILLSAWFFIMFARGLTGITFNIFDITTPNTPFRVVDENGQNIFRCQSRGKTSNVIPTQEADALTTQLNQKNLADAQKQQLAQTQQALTPKSGTPQPTGEIALSEPKGTNQHGESWSIAIDSSIKGKQLVTDAQLWADLLAATQALGYHVVITSANRTVEKNAAVGGATNSRHITGRALDLGFIGPTNPPIAVTPTNRYAKTLAAWLRDNRGYNIGSERGFVKAVLLGDSGHLDHLHMSIATNQ